MIEMTMSSNIAKRTIPLCLANNAFSLVSARKHSCRDATLVTAMSVALPQLRNVVRNSLCNSIPTTALPYLHLVKEMVATAHDPSESDPPAIIPPEIPSVPAAYATPSFPPEVPEPVGPEIIPDPFPQKPPGVPEFPGTPIPSPPGPDVPMPPTPDTVPPPPPDVVPPKPPEIGPPLPNMPPDITPPTGPNFAVAKG